MLLKMPGSFELLVREWKNMDLGHRRYSYLSKLTSPKAQAWRKHKYLIDYLTKMNVEDSSGALLEDTAKKKIKRGPNCPFLNFTLS